MAMESREFLGFVETGLLLTDLHLGHYEAVVRLSFAGSKSSLP